MIITVSGPAGVGKDTIADLLTLRLKIPLIRGSLRVFAKQKKLDILDFEKKFTSDSDYWDKKLDQWQKQEVAKAGSCILVSMLGAINIPGADLKVWLDGEEKVRAQRLGQRDGLSAKKALIYLRERDRFFREKTQRIYGVDFWQPKFYDLSIDTSDLTPQEIIDRISEQIKMMNQAIKVLKKGGVGIFPTETAYGIGCRMDNTLAVKRLIKIRGREKEKPFLILVDSLETAKKYWQKPPAAMAKLIKKYWPGPLTIVYYCQQDLVPVAVRAGKDTLGMRLPDYGMTRQLVKAVGAPLLAPSANLAGETTPYRLNEINPRLLEAVDFVLKLPCGGYRQTSTVIDCTRNPWQILRQGAVKIALKSN